MCCYEFVFVVMVLFFISLFVLALYSLPRALSLYIVYIIVSLFLSFSLFVLLVFYKSRFQLMPPSMGSCGFKQLHRFNN